MTHQDARAQSADRLWSAYLSHPDRALREQLIERHRGLAYAILHRMGRRGDEDLEQVALMGLVKAVDRFDPATGNSFSSFAVPTIVGEVKRYLRDETRVLRPPRPVLDLRTAALATEAELTARAGQSPSVTAIAAALGVEVDRVVEALAMEETCRPRSLDGLMATVEQVRSPALEECLGVEDPALERAEARVAWRQELATLEPRLQRVLKLRYYQNLSQEKAARRLGVSQMQVSRLERRALAELRSHLVGV